MFKPLFALLLSVFLFAACDSADSDDPQTVRFQIEVMENTTTVATGQFTFEEPAQGSSTTGTFSLSTPSGDPLDPVASTSGTLSASLTIEGGILLTMSEPNTSDSGLSFEGDSYATSGFSGVWGTITIVGYTEQGTFTATATN